MCEPEPVSVDNGASLDIRFVRLAHAAGLPVPDYRTSGAAGLDLSAALAEDAGLRLVPGQRRLVPTGLALQLPAGFEGQIRPRSSLALRHGVTVLNAPGTIDGDYRGEVMVLLVNFGNDDYVVVRGARIAQLVIAPVMKVRLVETTSLDASLRGAGGFGSTGT